MLGFEIGTGIPIGPRRDIVFAILVQIAERSTLTVERSCQMKLLEFMKNVLLRKSPLRPGTKNKRDSQ